MSVTTMIVMIVLIAGLVKVLSGRRLSHHHLAADRMRSDDDGETRRLNEEVRALKERIAVLERVVTDTHGSIGLEREIERLRDR